MSNVDSKEKKIPNVPNLRFSESSYLCCELKEVAVYRNKTSINIKRKYISTENLIQNFNGFSSYESDEFVKGVTFIKGDVLLGNIRPYLKKTLYAPFDGCCSTDVLVLEPKKINGLYLYYLISNDNFINYVMETCKGSKMPRGDKKWILSKNISIPSPGEQNKVAIFLESIDSRIKTQNKIIEDLKCVEKSLTNQLFDKFDGENKIKFLDLFVEYKELNYKNLPQFTIGKYGIKEMDQSDLYSRDKHIVFNKNSLILGIGIEECGVSLNFVGSCSPIYKTYSINNNLISTYFADIFIKSYLEDKKRFITQKSTRREFEIKYSDLNNIFFNVPSLEKQALYSSMVISIRNKIQNELKIKQRYETQKSYLLQNLFI